MLQALGLTDRAEAVYRALVAEQAGGVAELGERLGMGESQVRAGLDELVDLGLLTDSRDTPGRSGPSAPKPVSNSFSCAKSRSSQTSSGNSH